MMMMKSVTADGSSGNFNEWVRKMDGAAGREGGGGNTDKLQQGKNYMFLITNNKKQTL